MDALKRRYRREIQVARSRTGPASMKLPFGHRLCNNREAGRIMYERSVKRERMTLTESKHGHHLYHL